MKKYIYLIAYDYHSSFGKLVKMKSNSIYNHAGLSLTRDLHPTYTYVRNNNVVNDKRYRHGFSEEELSDILQKDDEAKMKVIEVEVDSYQYEKAEALIEGFIKDASKTTYDFFNLSTIALNIKRKYYNLPDYSFICSEFVAYIMNEIGKPISDKSINLTLPSDIANADKTMKNAKVIYNGLISEYMITTESYIMEMKRSELPDSEFGVPEERKYPLETKEHVYSAIKLFNHVNPKYEAELARNIKRKMKEYNITNISVGPNNRFGKYYREGVKESMDIITESSTLYDAPPVKNVIMYKNNGMNNAIVSIHGSNVKLRGRSEVLVFKKDKVYLAFKGDKYRIPGGSWEPNESHADTAIRETQEETRMNIIRPKYITSYVEEDDKPKQWVIDTIPKNMQWKGYYIDLYTAEYIGRYDGYINDHDKDNMVNIGKFYNIEDVYDKLNPYHKKAVESYIFDTGIEVNIYGNEVKESMEYLEESYLLNTDDIYYNKNKFDSGEINLCFITGHSGSGKSTMARNMTKNNIEHYELDDVIYNKEHFSMENFREYGDLIYSFFKGPGKKYYCTTEECRDGRFNGHDYEKELTEDFVDYSIKYAKSHKNKKFVIEGVWLFMNIEPEKLKDYAVYIKGTSQIVSAIRASKRDWENDIEDPGDLTKSIPAKVKWLYRRVTNDIRNGREFERKIQKYRDYFSKKVVSESYEGNIMDIITEAKKYEVITDKERLQKSIDEIKKSKDPNLVKMGKAMDVAIRNDFENPNALLGAINVVILMGLATPPILLTIISILAIMASLLPLTLYAKLLIAHRNFLKSRVKPDEITKSYYVALNELIKTGSIESIVIEGYIEVDDEVSYHDDSPIFGHINSITPYCESLRLLYKNKGIDIYDETKLVWGNYDRMMESCFVVEPKYLSLQKKKRSFLSEDYLTSNIMTLRQYDIFPSLSTEHILSSYIQYVNNSIDYILKHPDESPLNMRIYNTYNKCINVDKISPRFATNIIFKEYFFSDKMKECYDKYGEQGLCDLLNLKLATSLEVMNKLVTIYSRLVSHLSEDYIAAFTTASVSSSERQRIVDEVMNALTREVESNISDSNNYNIIHMSQYDSRCGDIYMADDTIKSVIFSSQRDEYDLNPIRQAIGYSFVYDAVYIGHGIDMYHNDGKPYEEDFGVKEVVIDGLSCRSATEVIDKLIELGNKRILLIACNMSPKSSEHIQKKYANTDATIVIAGTELIMEQYSADDFPKMICVNVDHYSDPKNIKLMNNPIHNIMYVQEGTVSNDIYLIKNEMIKCIEDVKSIYSIFDDMYSRYLPVYMDISAVFEYVDLYTGKRKEKYITSYQQLQKVHAMIYNQISSIIMGIGKDCNKCMSVYGKLVSDKLKYDKKTAFMGESSSISIPREEIKLALEDIKNELENSYHPVTEAPNEEDDQNEEKDKGNTETHEEENQDDEEQNETEDGEDNPDDETIEPTTDAETDDEPIEDEAEDTSTDYTDDVTDPDDTGEPDQADDYTTDVDTPDDEDQAEGDDLTATDFTGGVADEFNDEEVETGEPATDEAEDQPTAEEPEGDIPEGETGEEGTEDEAGMEEPTDFTDGVDGAEGEDTGDEEVPDETADETGEEPVENEQDNNNLQNSIVKNYNLMVDFQKIYQSIEDILKHLKSVNYTTSIQNSVLERCINNLTNLKNEVLTYIEYDYSSDYKTNLYYYTTYVQALKIVLEMLRSIQMLNKESNNNLKSKNSKGV